MNNFLIDVIILHKQTQNPALFTEF